MLYAFGEWELDVGRYELRRAGHPIKLEPQVFSVLAYLVQHHDRVLSKQELFSHLWPGQFLGDSALERCIMAARKAVGDSGGQQRIIKTFHRRGYRFVAPVTKLLPSSATGPITLLPNGPYEPAETEVSPLSALSPSAPSHRQVTVLSCAIANIREQVDAEASGAMQDRLKSLFDRIAAHVQSYNGMMALSHDDGVLALFGASAPCDDHALKAVKAAMALPEQLVQGPLSSDGLPTPLALCMGLHTGDIIGKRFGDDPQMIYMAVDNTLQFATNLQACTPPGMILASEATYRLVQHAVCGEVAGLVSLQAGARHTVAYHLSHLLTASETAALNSPQMPTAQMPTAQMPNGMG